MEQLRDVARQYFHSRRTRLALRYTTMPADDEYESIIARGVGQPPLCTFRQQQREAARGNVGALQPAQGGALAPFPPRKDEICVVFLVNGSVALKQCFTGSRLSPSQVDAVCRAARFIGAGSPEAPYLTGAR